MIKVTFQDWLLTLNELVEKYANEFKSLKEWEEIFGDNNYRVISKNFEFKKNLNGEYEILVNSFRK